MRTLNAAGAETHILVICHVWPIGSVLLLVGVVRLVHGLLVERARRKTLQMLCELAPKGTLVVQQQGSGVPGIAVKVGGRVSEGEQSTGPHRSLRDGECR